MMPTKQDQPEKPDEKGPDVEPASAPQSASPLRPKRIPRLQTATELRGFSVSPKGTALGVGGPTPGKSSEPDSYYDDGDDISPEEAAKIEDLLEFVSKDIHDRPRPRRGGVAAEAGRATGKPERAEPDPATAAASRERKGTGGLLAWIALGAVIGIGAPWLLFARSHAAPAVEVAAPPSTPVVAARHPEVVVPSAAALPAAEPVPQERGDAAPHATTPVQPPPAPGATAPSTLPIKPTFQVQN